MKYWINTVSRDHVRRGLEGGFTQANHGRPQALRRLMAGDYIVFYSPKEDFAGNSPLQAFTALGQVVDDALYQVEVAPGFTPWRRNVAFRVCEEAPIRPLIAELTFIRDKTKWGYPFRVGLFEIPRDDFHIIARAMNVTVEG
jgi:hypothetical protein